MGYGEGLIDVRALLASPLGFLIGLSLGALGGGGSILAVPVLVYVAGQEASAATTTSLVLVIITAAIGIAPHWRAGRVRVGAGLLFALAGVAATIVGSQLNDRADPDVLLLLFSGVMVLAASGMYRSARRRMALHAAAAAAGPAAAPRPLSAAAAVPVHAPAVDAGRIAKVVVAGSAVGLMTGFFGVGGGFVVVPALVLSLGFSMPDAVGTSLLVIVLNSLVALGMRAGDGGIEWSVVLPFALSSTAGVLVGGRLAGRRDPSHLQIVFAALLIAVAVYTATKSAVAIW